MARRRRAGLDKIQESYEIDFTSMIDVTFQLLIFFMLTLKFKVLEGKLQSLLPADKGLSSKQEQIEFEDLEIILKVLEEDKGKPASERRVRYFRNKSNTPFGVSTPEWDAERKQFKCDPPDTMDRIRAHMKSVREAAPEAKAKINAWPEVPN
ncbi:MAG TPA: biopolymer transporter ExbD, partial [Planctomycetota bacterium]|nr:biopolymer transporter ExbD [Planctomycetota bacterium]